MDFIVHDKDKNSKARTGGMIMEHGCVYTPAFMPVGTQGAVKAVHINELKKDVQAEMFHGLQPTPLNTIPCTTG